MPTLAPVVYADPQGNEIALRAVLSAATRTAIAGVTATGAASADDAWRRRSELLFERLAVTWTISGLEPISRQRELLARYRFSSGAEREWVDATVRRHATEHFPELT